MGKSIRLRLQREMMTAYLCFRGPLCTIRLNIQAQQVHGARRQERVLCGHAALEKWSWYGNSFKRCVDGSFFFFSCVLVTKVLAQESAMVNIACKIFRHSFQSVY